MQREEEVETQIKNGNCDKSNEQIFREVDFLRLKLKHKLTKNLLQMKI